MTQQELAELLESWENLDFIIGEVNNRPDYLTLLVEIALHSVHQKRWRAAWIIDKINATAPAQVAPFLEQMILALKTETHPGIKRHLLKLISLHELPGKQESFLLDYCLQCFTTASEPVAVRVHAMQVLFNLSQKEPELKPELLSIIEHEVEVHATPGIRSRGKKLARELHRQIRESGIQFF